MSDASKLKGIELFKNIDDRILASLAKVLREEHFNDGQIIFSEDDKSDEIYFIFSGEVEIVKTVNREAGIAQSLSSLGKGDFFGEMALFDKKNRSATVKAKGEAVLLKLSCKDFYYFLKNDAQIAVSILGGMLGSTIKRLRETDIGYATIYETGRLLACEQNINKLLANVLGKIMEIIPGAQNGFMALWNEFAEMFEVHCSQGFSTAGEIALQKNDAIIKWLKENKERLVVEDAAKTEIFGRNALPRYCGLSFVVQPLIHRGELLGFFLVSNRSEKIDISRSQINLLSGIASQIAPVIANAKKIEEDQNRRRLQRARTW
ncbi:MAG TPA: cyclic nucleotide-binding domain-containing protein [Candidatus Omnitrophota bacterium]|nr:cyclic nucleotide-binding domain-containing protein [Candidatus Omnitrophota bacterium]